MQQTSSFFLSRNRNHQIKSLLNKVFKYSGLKSGYFRYVANRDKRKIKCPILLYHAIGDDALPPQLLERHLYSLCSAFSIITIRELYQGIIYDNLPKNPLVITFDDGYRDIYELVLPILNKYQAVATVFIASGYIEGEYRGRPTMSQQQIKDLAGYGVEIGSHARTHPNLKRLNQDGMMAELAVSKTELENIIGAPVISVSYPFGLYNTKVLEIAEKIEFKIGVTTVHDFFVNPNRLLECPRILAYPYDSCKDLEAKLNGDQHWLKILQKLYRPNMGV